MFIERAQRAQSLRIKVIYSSSAKCEVNRRLVSVAIFGEL